MYTYLWCSGAPPHSKRCLLEQWLCQSPPHVGWNPSPPTGGRWILRLDWSWRELNEPIKDIFFSKHTNQFIFRKTYQTFNCVPYISNLILVDYFYTPQVLRWHWYIIVDVASYFLKINKELVFNTAYVYHLFKFNVNKQSTDMDHWKFISIYFEI